MVSVLWALSILSLIAASMMSTGSLSVAMERNALRRAQADAIADATIALAVVGLLDPRPEKRWRVDGVAQDASFAGVALQISIQDEYGLIDLNQADADLFRGLFRSVGVKDDESRRLADRVVAWRTAGSARAELAEYRAAGLSHAPRGRPFQSVDELGLVLGVTPEMYRRVEPALTVHSQQPGVDRRIAPREALLALPGMDARQVEAILAERRSGARSLDMQGLPLGTGIIDPGLALNGRAFAVTAAFTYRGTTSRKRTVIRLSSGRDQTRSYMELD